jgi:hypothetical protein
MTNILVYEYEQFDTRTRHWIRATDFGTADAIRRAGGRIVAGSGRQLSAEAVSDKGFARQPKGVATR